MSYDSISGSSSVSSSSHVGAAVLEATASADGTARRPRTKSSNNKTNDQHRATQSSIALATGSTPHLNKAFSKGVNNAKAARHHSFSVPATPGKSSSGSEARRKAGAAGGGQAQTAGGSTIDLSGTTTNASSQEGRTDTDLKRRIRRTSLHAKKTKEECAVM